MKKLVLFSAFATFAMAACGGASSPPDAVQFFDANPNPDSATSFDANSTAAPVISLVEWTHGVQCAQGTRGDVMVTITATDADTAPGNLTYSGSVSSCTGTIAAANATVTCPEAAPYNGSVTVTDPENNSDTVNFTISPCTDGTAP